MINYQMINENSDDFPFTFGRAQLDSEGFDVHGHDYSEIVIITSGRGIHSAEGISYPVKGGDIFIIHKGLSHGFKECHALEMINIGFSNPHPRSEIVNSIPGVRILFELEPQIRQAGDYKSRLHLSPLQMEKILLIVKEMETEMQAKDKGYNFVFENLFVNLLILLGRCYDSSTYSPMKKMIKLSACIGELEQNYLEALDLQSIVDKHGYTKSHFIRSFKKIFGITPLQYVIQMRLSRAMNLLEKEEFNISETAYRCGFDDSNYFSRLFKKKTGLSPMEFRRKKYYNSKYAHE